MQLDFEADGDLVQQAIRKDPAAMRAIVDRHKDSVYRMAYRLTGDADAAEDVAQDTFLKVFQNLNRLENGRALSQWIRQIAHNLIRDRWRMKKETVPFEEDHPAVPASSSNPHAALEATEVDEHIQLALMKLSDANRVAFVMKHVEEMSYEEIAGTLGISVSAAKVRAHRACRLLRGLLDEFEPFPENGR